jgi:hypothetical protein
LNTFHAAVARPASAASLPTNAREPSKPADQPPESSKPVELEDEEVDTAGGTGVAEDRTLLICPFEVISVKEVPAKPFSGTDLGSGR